MPSPAEPDQAQTDLATTAPPSQTQPYQATPHRACHDCRAEPYPDKPCLTRPRHLSTQPVLRYSSKMSAHSSRCSNFDRNAAISRRSC
jgi:hypothetical protein